MASTTLTITKPDLDQIRDVQPKAPQPYKVVVVDWSTIHTLCRSISRHFHGQSHC